jgi:hypothetical protein
LLQHVIARGIGETRIFSDEMGDTSYF